MATTARNTAGKERQRVRLSARWLLPVGLSVLSVDRADVDFRPEIRVGVAHTDNVTLAPENEESAVVYELLPSFTLAQQSSRLVSNVGYFADAYHYRERRDNSVYHSFTGDVSLALDPQNLFLELGGNRIQTTIDPEEPIPRTNLPISRNRVDRDQGYLGPAFQYGLGANATARGSFRRSAVRYDEDEVRAMLVDLDDIRDTPVYRVIAEMARDRGARRRASCRSAASARRAWHREAGCSR